MWELLIYLHLYNDNQWQPHSIDNVSNWGSPLYITGWHMKLWTIFTFWMLMFNKEHIHFLFCFVLSFSSLNSNNPRTLVWSCSENHLWSVCWVLYIIHLLIAQFSVVEIWSRSFFLLIWTQNKNLNQYLGILPHNFIFAQINNNTKCWWSEWFSGGTSSKFVRSVFLCNLTASMPFFNILHFTIFFHLPHLIEKCQV